MAYSPVSSASRLLVLGASFALASASAGCGDDATASTGGGGGASSSAFTGSASTGSAPTGSSSTGSSSSSQATSSQSSASTGQGGSGAGGAGGAGQGGAGGAGQGGAGGAGQGGAGGAGQGGEGGSSPSVGNTLAVRAWFLGDTTREGVASATAWHDFAVDLDGLDTQADLTGHCDPPSSFGKTEDAPGGGDNSFGKNIISFLSALVEDPSAAATASHDEGEGTLAFQVFPIDSRPDPLLGALRPLEDRVGDTWQLDPLGLVGGDPAEPAYRFDDAAIVADRFEGAASDRIGLRIWIQGSPLDLEIEQAVLTIDLDAQQGTGEGTLAGVIDTEAFIQTLSPWLEEISGGGDGLCPGDQLFESIAQNIRVAQDMPLSGPQSEKVACDGISIGLGLDLHQVNADGVGELHVPVSACE